MERRTGPDHREELSRNSAACCELCSPLIGICIVLLYTVIELVADLDATQGEQEMHHGSAAKWSKLHGKSNKKQCVQPSAFLLV